MKKFLALAFLCLFLPSCETVMQRQATKEADAWKEAAPIVVKKCMKGNEDYVPKPQDAIKVNNCIQKIVDSKVMPVAVFPDLLIKMRADALEDSESYANGKISMAKYKANSMRRFADYIRTADNAIQIDAKVKEERVSQSLQKLSDDLKAQEAEQQRQLNEQLLIRSLSQPRSMTMNCYTYGNYTRCN